MTETKNKIYLYPFLIGLYPVISLLANNVTEIKFSDGYRSIAISLLLTAIVYLLLKTIVKNPQKAALLSALILILLFSYGHLHIYLEENPLFGLDLARIRYLVPLFALLLGIGAFVILWTKQDLAKLTQALGVISIVALLLPIFQIGLFLIQTQRAPSAFTTNKEADRLLNLSPTESAPDIYYIVLDGYSREDMLESFGYDNSAFIQELEEIGFYDARCSQANYSWTLPSLTSTLNIQYLNDGGDQTSINIEEKALYAMLDNNLVRAVLEHLGYSIVAFENGFEWLHWYDADKYYAPIGDEEGFLRLTVGMNGFELLFLETSAARLVIDTNILAPQKRTNLGISNPREIHRQRVLFTLETLPEISEQVSGPLFVYAHIVSPHDPYIFGPNGEWLDSDPEDTVQAFLDQTTYINTQILQVVENIIQTADGPTVIILQGDHGAPVDWPAGQEVNKLGILNTLYFTDQDGRENLYPSLSPVNTFRMIFNKYFDAELEILPDYSILGPSSPFMELPCE
jgi:hypothetical protein